MIKYFRKRKGFFKQNMLFSGKTFPIISFPEANKQTIEPEIPFFFKLTQLPQFYSMIILIYKGKSSVGSWEVGKGLRKMKTKKGFSSLHIVVKMRVRKPIEECLCVCVWKGTFTSLTLSLWPNQFMGWNSNAANIQPGVILGMQTSDLGISDPINTCPVFSLTT